jgi:CTP:phosphocholine cytidylyltransferase-like protein
MRIAIDFEGYVYADADEVKFLYIGQDEKPTISGKEYFSLSKNERQFYILEDLAKIINESTEVCWDNINIEAELETI